MCRNVSETRTLKIQFIPDEHAFPVLLAQRGYISEFTVQGIGPIPEKYKIKNLHKALCKEFQKEWFGSLRRDNIITQQ